MASDWPSLDEFIENTLESVRAPTREISRFVRKFPDACCAEVTRHGRSEPCDLTAVAVAKSTEAYDEGWWPVCRKHARGRELVSLEALVAAVRDEVHGG